MSEKHLINDISLYKTCWKCKVNTDQYPKWKKPAMKESSMYAWCKACWRDYQREAYHSKYREKSIARAISWAEKNPEKHKENCRKHTKTQRYKATTSKWKSANKDRLRHYDADKRAKRRSAIKDDSIPISAWRKLLAESKGICYWCEKKFKKPTMDHYTPLSKGGKHEIENIVVSCLSCNCSKQAADPIKFANKLGKLF